MLKRISAKQTIPRASSLLFPTLRASSRVSNIAGVRSVNTERISPSSEQQILVEQRKNRPMSPHLTIYQPQLTWYLSSLHRITGCVLAGGFLASLASYAALPWIGYPITVADAAAFWSQAPELLKYGVKSAIAFPFGFHAWNGIRHLIWDTGRELTIKGVYRTGYAVLGLATVTALGIAFL